MKKKIYCCLILGLALGIGGLGCDLDDDFQDSAEYSEETIYEDEETAEADDTETASDEEADNIDEAESTEDKNVIDDSTQDADSESANDDNADDTAIVEESYPVGEGAHISFDTVDINGNRFSNDDLKSSKLIMLNLWEPWCGPCVNEMPELNALYGDYKEKGLLIVGAYTTFEMDSDAREIVDEFGIEYPVIKCNKSIYTLEQDYVPATFLIDHDGNVITEEPFAGSGSYEDWEEVIKEYLE